MVYVENPSLSAISGFVYVIISFFCLLRFRRSGFAYLFVYLEYFYIVGIGFGALYLSLGFGLSGGFFGSYISVNGLIGNLTFLHVIAYSLGMILGAYYDDFLRLNRNVVDLRRVAGVEGVFLYRLLIFAGIGFLVCYMYLAGPLVALTSAARARAGSTEGLEEVTKFLFLKNIAQIGTLSIIFLPVVFQRQNKLIDILLLIVYGLFLYIFTGARAALMDTAVLALMIYFAYRRVSIGRKFAWFVILMTLGLLFTVYGKGLGDALFSSALVGDEVAISKSENFVEIILGQFIHLLFSIDAGIKNFSEEGFFLSKALLLAPLGIVPGWLYSNLGLDVISWQSVGVDHNIVCVNTMRFPEAEPCTIPPYYTGVSAYAGPLVGGAAFGFMKFFAYRVISNLWFQLKYSPDRLWLPLLLFLALAKLSLLIPNVIGLFSFFAFLGLFVYLARRLLLAAGTGVRRLGVRTLDGK